LCAGHNEFAARSGITPEPAHVIIFGTNYIMEQSQSHPAPRTQISRALKLFLAFAAGIVTGLLMVLFYPAPPRPSVLQNDSFPDGPGFAHQMHVLMHIYSNPYFVLAVDLIFAYIAIARPNYKNSWACAFLVGLSIPGILFSRIYLWT
jgi:hypothetical protein